MGGERQTAAKEKAMGDNKIVCVKALDMKVLCVCVERIDGWCAYIAAVEGKNHEKEAQSVYSHGNKMWKEVAEAVFGSGMVEYFQERGLRYVN